VREKYRSVWRAAAATIAAGAVAFALQLAVRVTPTPSDGPPAAPRALRVEDRDRWIESAQMWLEGRAPDLRARFQDLIYGVLPAPQQPRLVARTLVDAAGFKGAARIETWSLEVGDPRAPIRWSVAVAAPRATAPKAVIIAGNFCGDRLAFRGRFALPDPAALPARCRSAPGRALTTFAHGRSIIAPPVETILAQGFALVTFSPAEAAPDSAPTLAASHAAFRRAGLLGQEEAGVIALWAWAYLRVYDALQVDARFAGAPTALWGHSRHGKAALLAGAVDERPAAVVANQSGTFGASLTSGKQGETVRAITQRFPHWFSTQAREQARKAELDQHLLLALIAPRPLLLGNARLDKWSDAGAAFRAAQGASPVYELLGATGLAQQTMRDFDAHGDIGFFLRPGGHGVRPSDWRYTLEFLNAKFPDQRTNGMNRQRTRAP
jgi:hypothetical protein